MIWVEAIVRYKALHCKEDGTQMIDNLTKQERRGIAKLRKRSKAGEIVVSSTDKSGRLTICTMTNYLQQGSPHVAGDAKVSWKEVVKKRDEILCHTKMVSNIFRMGEAQGEKAEGRLRRALHEKVSTVPPLVLNQKDHKVVKDGIPAVRPVCEASRTMGQRLSDTLTDTLQAIYKSEEGAEASSTEDCLAKVEELNARIRQGEIKSDDLMIGSLDVAALYPSIDTKQAAKICRDKVRESTLDIQGVDYRQAMIYLKLTIKPVDIVDAGIQGILPRRLAKRGPKPGIKSAGADDLRER